MAMALLCIWIFHNKLNKFNNEVAQMLDDTKIIL